MTLMTNHIHMLVTPNAPKALAKLMQRACQRYAQQRNDRMNASGKLFEERYHSKVITDEEQLMMTTLYNDANAFRAGLVTTPINHAWSTVPLHAARGHSNVPRSMWTPTSWYKSLGSTSEARGRIYRQLIAAYAKHDVPEVIELETRDEGTYRQRIERPDGSSAREPLTQWGPKKG